MLLFGGDVAAGPFPHETIELLRGLDARFVMGNADRTLIDGTPREHVRLGDDPGRPRTTRTSCAASSRRSRSTTSSTATRRRPPTRSGSRSSPRTTSRAEILGEVGYPTLVQGHTHTQFDRLIGEHPRRQRRQRRDGQRRRARRLLAARRGRRAAAPAHRLRPRCGRRPPARERVADPRGVAAGARAQPAHAARGGGDGRSAEAVLSSGRPGKARSTGDKGGHATRPRRESAPSAPAPSAPCRA